MGSALCGSFSLGPKRSVLGHTLSSPLSIYQVGSSRLVRPSWGQVLCACPPYPSHSDPVKHARKGGDRKGTVGLCACPGTLSATSGFMLRCPHPESWSPG